MKGGRKYMRSYEGVGEGKNLERLNLTEIGKIEYLFIWKD
jgi:hypothetical protein